MHSIGQTSDQASLPEDRSISEAATLGEHALRVLERRNEAFRMLYDAVVEAENADDAQMFKVLCRNLRRICQADCAALASYDPETREVVLQAIEAEGFDSSNVSREQWSSRRVVTEEDIADLRHCQMLPCRQGVFRLLDMLPRCVAEEIRHDEKGSCRRVSSIRGGSLLALGMVYLAGGKRLRNQDVVETYLSLVGVMLQRLRASHTLRCSEQRYRSLIEATGTGYVITDTQGRVLDANCQYIRMTGRKQFTDIRGASVLDWTLPEDRSRYQNALSACTGEGGMRHLQITYQTPEGHLTHVEINASPVRVEDENRILALCSDVSTRRIMETRRSQAQKLEAIGQIAAGIAHEINTPTQFVGDNVRFLGDSMQTLLGVIQQQRKLLDAYREGRMKPESAAGTDAPANAENLDYLLEEIPMAVQQTLEGITRVSNIVSAMKEFSHPGTKEMTLVDLNVMLEKTLTVSRNEWQHCCILETNYANDLPLIPCFAGEINQVFLNIIVNAAQAVKEVVGDMRKGMLRIETRHKGSWAEVLIGDTGPGIPRSIQDQVFHPFFTTKDPGVGTGQGLSLAKTAVEKHGGEISFQTEVGKGTTFVIRLPVTQSHEDELEEEQSFGRVA
ncbi:MAG: PAS domain S-box protein [Phycisphaerae bacterium]|nr:PAS domain S-box protein [Phycisphaerae bacterium]